MTCKIWRKTDLWFGKWHEKFSKFSPEYSEVSKLGLWWDDFFVQTRKCVSLKFTEELCVVIMKNDTKIEKELTYRFKIDMRNLTNLNSSNRKFKSLRNLCFNGLLVTKVYNVSTKKVPRSYFSWNRRVMQNLKKSLLVVWKMTWEIRQIFTRALESFKIGSLMGFFCPK